MSDIEETLENTHLEEVESSLELEEGQVLEGSELEEEPEEIIEPKAPLDLYADRPTDDLSDILMVESVEMQLKKVLPGSFYMGANSGHYNEVPRRPIHLTRPFWMGVCPVTQDQYRTIKGKNPSMFGKLGPNHPVEKVNWNDSRDFCKKLTMEEREAGHIPEHLEFRLPTEAEWEYVCRAGSDEDFVTDINSLSWFYKNSNETTHEVGEKEPNNWGFFDMQGNVWEWTLDSCEFQEFEHYEAGGTLTAVDKNDMINPFSTTGSNRIAKGGCWLWGADSARPSARFINPPDSKYFVLGFRIVLAEVARPSFT